MMAFSLWPIVTASPNAAYLDLAVREGLPLASLDAALIRAAEQAGVGIFQP